MAEQPEVGETPGQGSPPIEAEMTTETPVAAAPLGDPPAEEVFGTPGPPINKASPFYIGFVGALGALIAWNVLKIVGNLSGVLTLVGVAAFLAIGLDPVVRWLQRRGLGRGWAVAAVFVAV